MVAEWNRGGALVLSIDLEVDIDQHSQALQRMESITERLIDLLEKYQMPATWAIGDPVQSSAFGAILSSRIGHEIALLGDPSWVGRGAGRTHFARELARRVQDARAAGLPVATLVLQEAVLEEHLDLLVKHKILVIRSGAIPAGKTDPILRPRSSRFGIWQAAATERLPGESRWWFGGAHQGARRAIERAIGSAQIVHFVVDGSRLVESESSGRSGLKTIERVLHCARQRRHQGLLAIDTLGRVAASFARVRRPAPARSILRPAA